MSINRKEIDMNEPALSAEIANSFAQVMTPEFVEIMLKMRAQYGTQEAAARIAQYGAERITANMAGRTPTDA